MLEKTWPTERKKVRRKDGSVELELAVKAFEEVASWVRSFGAAAEVIEPEELRERMRDEARRVVEMYGVNGKRREVKSNPAARNDETQVP